MSHSLCRVWLHLVFSTRNKEDLISISYEKDLFKFIKEKLFEELNIYVKIINGTSNHIHILLLLNSVVTIKDIVKFIKGSSSIWINKNNLCNECFSWQVGYSAYSVSEYNLEKVLNYIKNQKEHHKDVSFDKECEEFNKMIKSHD
ncbi:MAG TPA: transposase [Ignavibacteriaceae bacterium]|nr:transposase [Ignavibacteriaceae bacterium]